MADVLSNLNPKKFRTKLKKPYEQYTYEERINAGLRFPVQELAELAAEMFTVSETISYTDMKQYLNNSGLQGNDVTDLIDVLAIQKIITAKDYPNYILTKKELP